MLMPVIISFVLSTIFLNLGLAAEAVFFNGKNTASAETGLVLGVDEYRSAGRIAIEQGDNLNKAIVQVIEDIKSMRLQPLDDPARRLPESAEKKQRASEIAFDLPVESGAVLDCRNNDLFFSKRPDRAWPIASITKLFTAYVFLDYNPGWDAIYEIKSSDKREGGKIHLFTGEKVKIKDLFYASLVGSDNTATAALVSSTGMPEQEFAGKINEKIKSFGLKNTRIIDATGLKDGNISTAREISIFANMAFDREEISRALLAKKYEFATEQGRKKIVYSTNELLNVFPENEISILGGKTGYINASGYCFVSKFQKNGGGSIVTVVLGSGSESGRFSATKKLVDLYYGDNK